MSFACGYTDRIVQTHLLASIAGWPSRTAPVWRFLCKAAEWGIGAGAQTPALFVCAGVRSPAL